MRHPLYILADGHGEGNLSKFIVTHLAEITSSYLEEIPKKINTINQIIIDDNMEGGSTLTVLYIDDEESSIHVWKLGDSDVRMYHDGKATNLYQQSHSIPYHFSFKDNAAVFDVVTYQENIRVIAEKIVKQPYNKYYMKDGYLCRGKRRLNMTHALGDLNFHDVVCREPEYFTMKLPSAFTIVIASDGLWDMVEDPVILSYIESCGEKSTPLIPLLQEAILSWNARYDNIDDISIILISNKDIPGR